MSEVKDKCPKCGSKKAQGLSRTVKRFECGSHLWADDVFEESAYCPLHARIAELEAAVKESYTLLREAFLYHSVNGDSHSPNCSACKRDNLESKIEGILKVE